MPTWDALISENKHLALYVLQNISFLGSCEILKKLMPQEVPKTIQIDYFGAIGSDFLNLGVFYQKVIFW